MISPSTFAIVPLGILSKLMTLRYKFKIADQPEEFEQIFRLNYEIFAKEVGQHKTNEEGRLIDRFHKDNTYIVVKHRKKVVGMVCLTDPRDGQFSILDKMTHPEKIKPYLKNAVEVRLLSLQKEHRNLGISWKVGTMIGQLALDRGYDYAFLSGISHRRAMYEKFGFKVIDQAKKSGQAEFYPMVIHRSAFRKFLTSGKQ